MSELNTKETPGPFDGFATAKPGEPIFTLQGGDPLAGPLVVIWAKLARCRAGVGMPEQSQRAFTLAIQAATGNPIDDDAKNAAVLLRATEAEQIAWAMVDYRAGRQAEERPRSSYQDAQPDQVAFAAKEESEARLAGARRIDNLVAEALGVADYVLGLGDAPTARHIRLACDSLREAADKVRPARPGYMTPGGNND